MLLVLSSIKLYLQVDGGSNLSIKVSWSQRLSHSKGQFSLSIPFSFPQYVTPAGKKISKKEKIQLNVDSGPGTGLLCETTSHPLKVPPCMSDFDSVHNSINYQVT